MAKTTFNGYVRQYGGNKDATPGVFITAIIFSFDPTQASASVSKTLPKGAIPLGVRSLGGGTGGASPTVNVGTSADPDGFANELAADSVTGETVTGALIGVELTADTEIYAGVGASAATGGTTTVILEYAMADDGAHGTQ